MKKSKQKEMTIWIKSMCVGIGGLRGLAHRMGMSEATVYAKCRQPERWRLDELSAMRIACGVSREDFINNLAKFI